MTIDASGNLGLGVIPSAWPSPTYRAFQIGSTAALFSAAGEVLLDANTYVSTCFLDIYTSTDFATRYQQKSGQHRWFNAISGTSNCTVSFTQAMTLGCNSGLSIGTTSAAPANGLLVAGAATFSSSINATTDGTTAFVANTSSTTFNGGYSVKLNGVEKARHGFNTDLGAYLYSPTFSGYTITSDCKDWFKIASTGAATFSAGVTMVGLTNNSTSTFSSLATFNGNISLGGNSTLFSNGSATFSSSVTAGNLLSILGTDGGGKILYFTGGTTKYNFMIASQQNVDNALEITPSTTAGGSTFCTPALTILSNRNVGIGTTSPDTKLTVSGEILSENTDGGYFISTRVPSSSTRPTLNFYGTALDVNYVTGYAGSGTSTAVTIVSGGNVGIGTASPSSFSVPANKLVVGTTSGNNGITIAAGTTGYSSIYFADGITGNEAFRGYIVYEHSADALVLGTAASSRLTIASTGAVTVSNLANGAVTSTNGTLSASSDMNLKISDGYIDNALDKIMNLKPRYFYWKEESGLPIDIRQLGFYAQEVNQALGEETANTPKNENDKWGIYDRGIIAMLTKAIQEQQCTICLQSLMMNNLKICLGIK